MGGWCMEGLAGLGSWGQLSDGGAAAWVRVLAAAGACPSDQDLAGDSPFPSSPPALLLPPAPLPCLQSPLMALALGSCEVPPLPAPGAAGTPLGF